MLSTKRDLFNSAVYVVDILMHLLLVFSVILWILLVILETPHTDMATLWEAVTMVETFSPMIRFITRNQISWSQAKLYAAVGFTGVMVLKSLELLTKILLSVYTGLEPPEYRF